MKSFLLGFLCFCSLSISAQDKWDDLLKLPEGFDSYISFKDFQSFNSNPEVLSKKIKKNQNKTNIDWVVYSDRNANRLYSSADIEDANSESLDFLEPLYVLDYDGRWLEVVTVSEFKRSDNPESNWIPFDNLILNSFALTNEKNNPRKGMILVSIDAMANRNLDDIMDSKDLEKSFYFDPTLNHETGVVAKKFRIFFILKITDDGTYLLSSSDNLTSISDSPAELKSAVKGWVSKDVVTPWDSKLCLETTSYESDPLAYEDYNKKQIPIYKDANGIKNFLNQSTTASVNNATCIKVSTPKLDRLDPYIPRMPILDNFAFKSSSGKNLNVMKVACIAGLDIDSDQKDNDIAIISKKVQRVKKLMKNLDILFVVDATYSMRNYFSTISKTIEDVIKNQKGSSIDVRFGLSLYRHTLDGELACETITLTDNPEKILNKLNQEGICGSKNPNPNESQFNGIMEGIHRARFNNDHSNLMILIGDCGNDPSDGTSIDQVVNKINKHNVNVVAFQVKGGAKPEYYDFKDNIQAILKESAKRSSGGKYANHVELEKSTSVKNTNILRFSNFTQSGSDLAPKFGRYSYADGYSPMSTTILKNNIEQSIEVYMDKIKGTAARLEAILDGNTGPKGPVFTDEIIAILMGKPYNFTAKQIQLLQDQKDVSMMGYTSLNLYGKSTDAYSYSAFMSAAEHRKLKDLYGTLYYSIDNSNPTELRKVFQSQMIELTKSLIDPNIDDKVILNKTLGSVWKELTGIPLKTNKFKNLKDCTLRNLVIKGKLSPRDFAAFIEDTKADLLSFSEAQGHSKYKWEKNGTAYYFLPIDLIPGW